MHTHNECRKARFHRSNSISISMFPRVLSSRVVTRIDRNNTTHTQDSLPPKTTRGEASPWPRRVSRRFHAGSRPLSPHPLQHSRVEPQRLIKAGEPVGRAVVLRGKHGTRDRRDCLDRGSERATSIRRIRPRRRSRRTPRHQGPRKGVPRCRGRKSGHQRLAGRTRSTRTDCSTSSRSTSSDTGRYGTAVTNDISPPFILPFDSADRVTTFLSSEGPIRTSHGRNASSRLPISSPTGDAFLSF